MTNSIQFRDLRFSWPCCLGFMSSGCGTLSRGELLLDILKKNAPVFRSQVVQGTGTFFFYFLTLKLKTLHSFQMSGTTHPVTHHIPEVQHPQYLISLYISNSALSVTMKSLRNNHKNLRIAKTGSWNIQTKKKKC